MPDNRRIETRTLFNEWQEINSKLLTQIEKQDEIITKQQEIITTLEGGIDTRVTGSNVEKLSSKFEEDIVIRRTGNLEVGMWEVLFEHYGNECVLQSFALGTDYPHISLYIEARAGNMWEMVGIASPNGYIYTPSPYNLQLHSGGTNDFFKVQMYDEEKNNFVVTMTRPMTFSKGLRIRILNQNTENDHTVAVSALVSKKY